MSRSSRSHRPSGRPPEWEGGAPWRKPFVVASLALLAVALIAGGSSQPYSLSAAVVQLAALAMLPWAGYRALQADLFKASPLPFVIIGATILIPVIQLIPLPPAVWSALPGRELAVSIYEAAGQPLPWRPLSLTPELTLSYAVALSAPVVIFLAWGTLAPNERRLGVVVLMIVVVLGLLFGGVQLLGGGRAGYLYKQTNLGALVGLFANRNHEASLLVCALPFCAAIIAHEFARRRRGLLLAAACLVALLIVIGLGVARSRAGVLLFVPALLASAGILWRAGVFGGGRRMLLAGGGAVGISLLVVAMLALPAIRERFSEDALADMRFVVLPDLVKLGADNFPLGAGLGAMDSLYRSVERLDTLMPTYLNRAHNDYVEIWVDAGLPGMLLIALFVGWFLVAAFRAWTRPVGKVDAMALAGSASIALLLLHSALDYPLRTLAIAAVFAFSCACLAFSRGKSSRAEAT